ncbi:MAG TPA: lytic transglycosylase domain-containing protein, partial [Gemmatirosa sp.]|nr:lytic transglycosylase domain-containing protein [Gemmatirosa sp.]
LGGGEGARPGPGIRLAARAVAAGAPRTAAVERLLHPLLHEAVLREQARARDVDPALAAALVKQESNFTADAVSPAGARGLMQVMPATGRMLWRGPGSWDPGLLFVPSVNVALGMRHLADGLHGWPDVTYALAAYNAGAGRVRRWRTERGATDPELFAERIPFEETREYVRIVLRNRAVYRALYGL